MDNERVILLGGQSFRIKPLTFKQLRLVMPLAFKVRTGGGDAVDAMGDVLVIAIQRLQPDFKREMLDEMEVTFVELKAAMDAIMELSGLVKSPATGQPDLQPGGGLAGEVTAG